MTERISPPRLSSTATSHLDVDSKKREEILAHRKLNGLKSFSRKLHRYLSERKSDCLAEKFQVVNAQANGDLTDEDPIGSKKSPGS